MFSQVRAFHIAVFFFPPKQCLNFASRRKKPVENIVGKEENTGYQHFLLFTQRFLSINYKSYSALSSFLSSDALNFDCLLYWGLTPL